MSERVQKEGQPNIIILNWYSMYIVAVVVGREMRTGFMDCERAGCGVSDKMVVELWYRDRKCESR